VTPRLAAEPELREAWAEIALPMTPYLAACGWTVPAAGWFLEIGRRTLLFERAGLPVIAFVQPLGATPRAQLAVLSRLGPEIEGLDEIVAVLLDAAFRRLGGEKCEWRLLGGWSLAREAAARLGFQEEAALPGACLSGDRHDDVLIAGVLAHEARLP
jgi:hypothetical protein